jgi:hypothetical protein
MLQKIKNASHNENTLSDRGQYLGKATKNPSYKSFLSKNK